MTINLSKLLAGQTIILRDGEKHLITKIMYDEVDDSYLVTSISSSTSRTRHYWYHANGRSYEEEKPSEEDIVEIIEPQEWVEC